MHDLPRRIVLACRWNNTKNEKKRKNNSRTKHNHTQTNQKNNPHPPVEAHYSDGAYAPSCFQLCIIMIMKEDNVSLPENVLCFHSVCIRQGQLHSQSQVYRGPLHTAE